MKRTTITAIVLAVAVAGPRTTSAQDSQVIQEIRNRVSAGETVAVLDASGGRIVGTYVDSNDTALKLLGQQINGNRIARVTVKDSTRNGTLIGAAIGGAAGVVGGLLVGAICANEGGNCGGAAVGMMAIGLGAGAGIGWFADAMTEHQIYRAEGAPRDLSPEMRFRVAANKRASVHPAFGLSWSLTRDSGVGVEMNIDHLSGAGNGNERGYSVDGRALYAFGHGRIRPFVSGGVAYLRRQQDYRLEYAPSLVFPNGYLSEGRAQVDGLVPVFGAGVRVQTGRLVIRPELSWLGEPEQAPDSKSNLRLGVSIGLGW